MLTWRSLRTTASSSLHNSHPQVLASTLALEPVAPRLCVPSNLNQAGMQLKQ